MVLEPAGAKALEDNQGGPSVGAHVRHVREEISWEEQGPEARAFGILGIGALGYSLARLGPQEPSPGPPRLGQQGLTDSSQHVLTPQ